MAFDHEKWLRAQGIKITGRRTLRRAVNLGYMDWANPRDDGRIDWTHEFLTQREEQVYQVEIDEATIERLERFESTVKIAINDTYNASQGRHRRSSYAGYSGYNPNEVADYMIENRERHLELLKENEMYRDAWKEFQSIRVLLGETPHWP
jgi:hypothetical protein